MHKDEVDLEQGCRQLNTLLMPNTPLGSPSFLSFLSVSSSHDQGEKVGGGCYYGKPHNGVYEF